MYLVILLTCLMQKHVIEGIGCYMEQTQSIICKKLRIYLVKLHEKHVYIVLKEFLQFRGNRNGLFSL